MGDALRKKVFTFSPNERSRSPEYATRLSDALAQIDKLKLDKAKQTKKSPSANRRKKPSPPESKPL